MPPAKKTNTGGGDKAVITTTTTTAENGNQSRKRKANSSSSAKILDTSNWWSATQSSLPAGSFTLANFSLDCLRLLFDRIPRLPEALHLGLTCRRLFYVWEDVCKAKKKTLEIVSETVFSVELERQRKAFDGCPNIDGDLRESQRRFTEHPVSLTLPIEATTTELHRKLKRQPSKRRKRNGASNLPPVLLECPQNALQAIGRSFTHLHCLQLSIDLNSADWRPLLRQLFHSPFSSPSSSPPPSFPQLTTLTLCPHFFDSHATASPDYFWRPLSAELTAAQVPALRHLTLNIRSGLWSGRGQIDNERVRPAVVVRRQRQRAAPVAAPPQAQPPPYQPPPLPLLQQLASFAYNCEAEPFSETCRLIRQLMLLDGGDAPAYGAHLAPGTGARFGGRLFKDRCPHDPTTAAAFPPVCTCTDLYQTAALFDPTLLPYFTYLEVQVGGWKHREDPAVSPAHRDAVNSLVRTLPQMTYLQKVELTVGQMAGETDTAQFPRLYEALLSLPHLQDLSIGCHQYPTNPTLWPSSLPISGGGGGLPVSVAVRHLSLVYCSSAHVDIVQLFGLKHCFPALRTLHVHFYQHNCRHCTASEENRQPSCLERAVPDYQACGRELCRGLTGLQAAAAALGRGLTLQVKFTFLGHPFAHFSSLEKLWKGVPG